MSTTFSSYVSPYAKRDGTHAVQVRMTHARKSRYINTPIFIKPDQFTRGKRKIKDTAVADAVEAILRRYRAAAASVEGAEYLDADAMLRAVTAAMVPHGGWSLDIFEYMERRTASMPRKTAEGYRTAFRALERFCGKRSLDVNGITTQFVSAFREFLETEPPLANGSGKHPAKSRGSRAVSYYMTCVKTIHSMAREEFNDDGAGIVRIPRQPFGRSSIPPQPQTQHRVLTAGQIRSIAAWTGDPYTEMARDVFLLSFALIGMNTADMYHLRDEDLDGGIVTYRRMKTASRRQDHAEMRVEVLPMAAELMERYSGSSGMLLSFASMYSSHADFNRQINRRLKNIMPGLQMYHARHSWATIARNQCGASFDTVHEALNHARRGSDRVTDIYVERDWSAVWDANRRVMEFVFGHV